jgi:hypothetical protein
LETQCQMIYTHLRNGLYIYKCTTTKKAIGRLEDGILTQPYHVALGDYLFKKYGLMDAKLRDVNLEGLHYYLKKIKTIPESINGKTTTPNDSNV